MAARRLVIVMIVLLGISTLAAAFIPTTPKDPAGSTASERSPQQGLGSGGSQINDAPLGGDGLVNARVRISNAPAKVIAVRPGEQLVLEVTGSFGDDVEIPGLGLVETMSNYSPAVFDIYADEAGTFGVRTVETDLLVAKVVVSAVPPKLEVPADGQPGPEKQGTEPKGKGANEGGVPASEVSERSSAGPHGIERSLQPGPDLQ